MTHPFDLAFSSGQSIGQKVLEPLVKEGSNPTIVDVGARSGMFLLPQGYTSLSDFVGFEPNEVEYRKLVEERTDAMLQAGVRPRFRDKQYFNCAVWNKKEERDLYVTAGPGACTLMGPTRPAITDRMFLESGAGTHTESYRVQHTEVLRNIRVQCDCLDSLLGDRVVDFLKIDVEGAELRVLMGAEKLFEMYKILFIKTEFVNFPYYDEHPVFGHLHTFLNGHGFRLLDMDLDQPGYTRSPSTIPAHMDRRARYAGDAYFALDPDRISMDPESLQRLAAISLALGFRSHAVSLLADAGMLPEGAVRQIEAALSRISFRKKVFTKWCEFPYAVQRTLAAVGLRL